MRIFLGNDYFGAGNAGDDLSLHGFLAAAARHPDVELTVCTAHDLAGRQRCFPRIQWLPGDEAVRDDALRKADVWLGLGDTPFQLDSGPWLLDRNERERRRCAALDKPMYLLGVGCERAEAAADPRSQALLESVAHVWVRDEFSAAALRPFVDGAHLSTGADVAHLAFGDRTPAPPREPGAVGLLLAFEQSEQFDLHEIERFIERRAPGMTRWLVQEVRAFPHVERWLLDRIAPETRARLSVMEFDYATSSVDEYLRAFGAPELTVTSRYHGAVVAAWHGSKVLVVTRSAKVRGLADEFDLAHVDRADSYAAMEAGLQRAAVVPRERLQDARRRALTMCDAFFAECRAPRTRVAAVHAGARAKLAAISEPLPLESLRASIDAEIPSSLSTGETAIVRCAVTNLGDATYVSAPPNPVQLCYRWYDGGGVPHGAGTWIHTALPQPLAPGETVNTAMRVGAPPLPGRYQLAVSLLQESVAWFDDVAPASGARGEVNVEAGVIAPKKPETFFLLPPAERRQRTLQSIEARMPLLDRWDRIDESWRSE
ncbi:MAG: polysaccharide pyruvyl transferase family protein, partial [Candidatus Eremiobacteraeota bacterium]|nr:polysaccharide pyruvyl transferase family protein [Candidatus Eremiobacteraeota bacterium]